MQPIHVTRKQLCERFWTEIYPGLIKHAELAQVELLTLQTRGPYEEHMKNIVPEHLASFKPMLDEVNRRVKEELYDKSFMHFSCPTRFALLMFEFLTKHYRDVKREMLGPKAHEHIRIRGFEDYDVEADIAMTDRHLSEFKRGHMQLEREFFKFMDQKQFNDAAPLLRAIVLMRKEASIALQAEANNWCFEVACATGDVNMFVETWNKTHSSALVDPRILEALLEKLLYSGFIKGINVGLSADGLRAAKRAVSVEQFCNEQAEMYLRSVIESIAAYLMGGTCTSGDVLRDFVKDAFSRSQKSWLGVNPYLAVLEVVEK